MASLHMYGLVPYMLKPLIDLFACIYLPLKHEIILGAPLIVTSTP